MTQKLRDEHDSREQLAAVKAVLEADGKTIVEDAGHYGDHHTMRVDALKRADGEPATEEDANAVLISTDYRRQHTAVPVVTGWKELGFTPEVRTLRRRRRGAEGTDDRGAEGRAEDPDSQ